MVRVEEKDRCPRSWVLDLARSRIHYTAGCGDREICERVGYRQASEKGSKGFVRKWW